MARKKQPAKLAETVCGSDERGKYRIYRFTDGTEYMARAYAYFHDSSENGDTYLERKLSKCKPFDDVYPTNSAKLREWGRAKQEQALRDVHHREDIAVRLEKRS